MFNQFPCFRRLAGVLALGASVGVASPAFSATASDSAPAAATAPAAVPWNEEFAYLTGMQAYVYGFPAMHVRQPALPVDRERAGAGADGRQRVLAFA